jgi:hypothetical protein
MGSQQLLMIIFGVIVVGIAIAVGISTMFGQSIEAQKSAVITELSSLAEDARAFYTRPRSLGGGGRSYLRYAIPTNKRQTENALYSCTTTDRRVFFTATSKTNPGNIIRVTLRRFGDDAEDLLTNWTYSGDFQQ